MLYRKLGNTGIDASVIALGTWVMGGWMWGGADDKESIKAIHASLDNGINMLDTAPIYGFGRSEEVVGKAIKDRRDKVVLATKCGMRWDLQKGELYFHSDDDGIAGEDEAKRKVYKYLGPESIREEVENSLRRLQTDYIDLYQTHWQESTTPIAETMAELLTLKEEGKIRSIGVSNASVEQMKEYGEIASDQEKYSMFVRNIDENGNTDYCIDNNIAILAYSPLAQGLLTGKITSDRTFNKGDVRLNNPLFQPESLQKINSMLNDIKPIAEKHDVELTHLTLAWTFHRKGISHLLVGARNEKQAVENAKAGEVKLSEAEIKSIDDAFKMYFG